jgi:hypothetical protein
MDAPTPATDSPFERAGVDQPPATGGLERSRTGNPSGSVAGLFSQIQVAHYSARLFLICALFFYYFKKLNFRNLSV